MLLNYLLQWICGQNLLKTAVHAVDVIYFDFTKAFDSVPHTHLLTKLESYGLTEKLLGWLRNYLVGRRQKVVILQLGVG